MATRSAEGILAQIRGLTSNAAAPAVEELRNPYRQAAAVLVSIGNARELRSVGEPSPTADAERVLGAELIPAAGRRLQDRVMLRHESRRQALMDLATPGAMLDALACNPAERKDLPERERLVQQQLEGYIKGDTRPIQQQTGVELEASLQALVWLEGILPSLPGLDAVRRQLERVNFIATFESLAGDELFRGRVHELDRLRGYVGSLAPERLAARVLAQVERWVRPVARPAVSVAGPGGIGKSALIARFVLEHSRLPEDQRIPFAYLDLDNPTLNVAEPLVLVEEMFRQLAMQFPDWQFVGELYKSVGTSLSELAAEESSDQPDPQQRAGFLLEVLLRNLEAELGPRPFLIILDTFEQVQYRGESLAFPLWELLTRIQESWPFLRVVVSGRAPVTTLRLAGEPPISMQLGDLDQEAAVAFVQAHGITSPEVARSIVRQVGGVPLSLKLAASLLRKSPDTELAISSGYLLRSADEVVQGQLYARVLEQIQDPEVQRVAHPGLVLRRITPETLLEVLKVPCQLTLRNLSDASDLFEKLRREVSLVSSDDVGGALLHRRDLRRVMLKFLIRRSPRQAEQISTLAVRFYAARTDVQSRAEEVYHRLLLGEKVSKDRLSDPEVRASIQASVEELPMQSQRLLATFGLRVEPSVLEKATVAERDSALAERIEQRLAHPTALRDAERMLRERKDVTGDSALWRAWARVLLETGDTHGALDKLESGLRFAAEESNDPRVLELLSDKAWACELDQRRPDLEATLELLAKYAARYDNPVYGLQQWLQRRCWNADASGRSVSQDDLRGELKTYLDRLRPRQFFGLVPATSPLWSDPALASIVEWERVVKLITEPDSPFDVVSLPSQKAASALQRVVRMAYLLGGGETGFIQERTALAASLYELAHAWPYRNLHVSPPETHRSSIMA